MVKPLQNVIFLEGRSAKYLFQEICSSGGKQTIHKVSAAFIVKNFYPRTSLTAGALVFREETIRLFYAKLIEFEAPLVIAHCVGYLNMDYNSCLKQCCNRRKFSWSKICSSKENYPYNNQ